MTGWRGRTALSVLVAAAATSGCAALASQQPLTFQVDKLQCAPSNGANTLGNVCSFFAYYGNVSSHSVQVEPGTTTVMDKNGRKYTPTAAGSSAAFLLKPGRQQSVEWTVTLPANVRPTLVVWHGSKVSLRFSSPPLPSVQPSASAVPSATPSATPSAGPTTPSPTPAPTTTKPKPKPTKTKPSPKPTKTSPKPTTRPPTTTPPPPVAPTTHRPTHRPVTHAPTTNPTNPGGGSGGIG